ncbi:OLC1v1038105C1 [Oldenlandia corymbosa var. corymbosa]|uniref:OLC1v1038105C1 n=1 Tax=Oldenlandia corymbosa var. corymbosa TaxID=529605 RepID=A0AAV1CZ48_OLDCO|nr:OLC1v1038105C1 [Oldenlandia corymbosa var. corymbosa]
MGKQGTKTKQLGSKPSGSNLRQSKGSENSPRAYDKDTAVFIAMSHELKDEGNKLFQKKDYEGAILKYEKAIKLLPRNHIDVSYLRSNMAACFMQMGLSEYPRAIHECNLALEVTPKYSKALLKRSRCYEALNRLDLALRDVTTVLNMEPNNLMALEISERVKTTIQQRGTAENEIPVDLVPVPEYMEPSLSSDPTKALKEKVRKKKMNREQEKKASVRDEGSKGAIQIEEKPEPKVDVARSEKKFEEETEAKIDDKKAEDKLVVEEQITTTAEKEPQRTVKLVFGEDIRWAQIPVNCSILKLREAIGDRFPGLRAVLIKYRDHESDLVTITTTEELRWAEAAADHGSLRLYLVEVNPEQDPFYKKLNNKDDVYELGMKKNKKMENGHMELLNQPVCIEDWIIQFAYLFKNYVGFDPDSYLDLNELGMKLYSEGLEEAVTSEEAQDYLTMASDKFQEMAALALFNWGNVHMSRARKKVYLTEDASRESVLEQVKIAYEWAQNEYSEAGKKYEEALHIMPNFYEAVLALGQQQFEQAKLSWYYAIGTNADLELWPSTPVLELYNRAEENMERGMQMWEDAEELRLHKLQTPNKVKGLLQKMNLVDMVKDISDDESAEQAASMRSQINVLWGTMLYERSMMEFKLGLPVWHECLEVAVEKFELAGASPTDIAVMMKNHCCNDTAAEGLGFNIDEIVQAWNEMYEAKRWQSGIPSFRLEPLLRRRVSKLYYALELA